MTNIYQDLNIAPPEQNSSQPKINNLYQDLNIPLPTQNKMIAKTQQPNGLQTNIIPNMTPKDSEGIPSKILDVINAYGSGAGQSLMTLGTLPINAARFIAHLPSIDTPSFSAGLDPSVQAGIAKHPGIEKLGEIINPYTAALPLVKAGKLLKFLGVGGEGLMSQLGEKALTGAATGGTYGALFDPQHPVEGAVGGMALGAPLGVAGGAASTTLQSMLDNLTKKSQLEGAVVRSPAVAKNVYDSIHQLYPDLKINFGDLVNTPWLSNLYHDYLSNIPFTGAQASGEALLAATDTHAKKIMSSLLGNNDPAAVDNQLVNTVKTNYENLKNQIGQRYENVYSSADSKGINVNPTNLNEFANNVLGDMKENQEFEKYISPDVKKSLTIASTLGESSVPNIRTNISLYGEDANRAALSGRSREASILTNLKLEAEKDLTDSLNNSGKVSSDLLDQLNSANNDYKKFIGPYKTNAMRKLMFGSTNSDKAADVILKNPDVLSQLSQDDKNLVAFRKYSGSSGATVDMTNPTTLNTNNKNNNFLSPNQKAVLFKDNPKIMKNFGILDNLVKMAREPALKQNRAPTGMRIIGQGLQGLLGAGIASFAPKTVLSTLGGGKALSSLLTSDFLRNAYLKGEVPKMNLPSSGIGGILKGTTGPATPYSILSQLLNVGQLQQTKQGQ